MNSPRKLRKGQPAQELARDEFEVFDNVAATLSARVKEAAGSKDEVLGLIGKWCVVDEEGGLIRLSGKWGSLDAARLVLLEHMRNSTQQTVEAASTLSCESKTNSAITKSTETNQSDLKLSEIKSGSLLGTSRRKRGRPRKTPLAKKTSDVSATSSVESPEGDARNNPQKSQLDCDSTEDVARDNSEDNLLESGLAEEPVSKSSRVTDDTENAPHAQLAPLPQHAQHPTGAIDNPSSVRKDASERPLISYSATKRRNLSKTHDCKTCNGAFGSLRKLQQHLRSHKSPRLKRETLISAEIVEGDSGNVILQDNIVLIDNFTSAGQKCYVCKRCNSRLTTKCLAVKHWKEKHEDGLEDITRGRHQSDGNTRGQQEDGCCNSNSEKDSEPLNDETLIESHDKKCDNSSQLAQDTESELEKAEESHGQNGSTFSDNSPAETNSNSENDNYREKDSNGTKEESNEDNSEGGTDTQQNSELYLKEIGRKVCAPTRSLMLKEPEKATEKCKHCGFRSSATGIKSHISRYHNSVLYFCDVCDKSFGIAGELNAHRKRHFDTEGNKKPLNWRIGYQYKKPGVPGNFSCKECQKSFHRNVDLKHHMAVHQNGATYQCGMCTFKSTNLAKVKGHIDRSHSKNINETCGPFNCEECKRVFTSEVRLQQHKEKAHGRDFTCDQCGKQFACYRYLFTHKKRHSEVKRYSCGVCGRGFHENNKLQIHKESHLPDSEKERRHFCEVCHKSFSSSNYLRDHMNIHSGATPYQCGVCGRLFPTQVACRRHAMGHNKELKHKCPVKECGKMFNAPFRLRHHMTTHTKVSKYTCDLCNKAYTQMATLRRHACKARGATNTAGGPTLKNISEASEQVNDQIIAPLTLMQDSQFHAVSSDQIHIEKTMYCCSVCQMVYDDWDAIQIHVSEHSSENVTGICDSEAPANITDSMTDNATDDIAETITGAINSSVSDNSKVAMVIQPIPHIQTLATANALGDAFGNNTVGDALMEQNVVMETIVLTDNSHMERIEPEILTDNETQLQIVAPQPVASSVVLNKANAEVSSILTEEPEQYYNFGSPEKCSATMANEETIVTMEMNIVDQE